MGGRAQELHGDDYRGGVQWLMAAHLSGGNTRWLHPERASMGSRTAGGSGPDLGAPAPGADIRSARHLSFQTGVTVCSLRTHRAAEQQVAPRSACRTGAGLLKTRWPSASFAPSRSTCIRGMPVREINAILEDQYGWRYRRMSSRQ